MGKRAGKAAAAGKGRGARTAESLFVFEALEPRLLLSADLNYAAGQAFLGGLGALDSTLNSLATSTALSSSAPFVSRSLSDVAGLNAFAGLGASQAAGDPIAAIKAAATTYFAANTSATAPTKVGSVAGLASALSGLATTSGALTVTVQASDVTTGADDLLSLKLVSSNTQTNVSTAISQSANGNTLSTTQNLTKQTTQTLNLLFGVDVATASAPVFEVQSFGVTGAATLTGPGTNNGGLTGSAIVNGTSQTIAGGAADIVVNVDDRLNASAAAPITWTTSSNGFASAASGVTPALTGVSTLNLVTVTPASNAAASQVKLDDDLSKAGSLSFTVSAIPPSALEDDVLNVFNDLNSEISNIQSSITSSTSFAFDLPLIGPQLSKILNPDTLLSPLTNEINALETKIKSDFADSAMALTQVQDDVVNALSSVKLLPDANPASDVVFKYTASNASGTQTLSAGSAVDLSKITQLEIDLTLGQTVLGSAPLGTDLGIPGLGLKVNPGSSLQTSVGWTLQVGLGMIAQSGAPNPANAYLALGGAGGPASGANNPTNAAFNFNVDLYLSNGFQAVGKIGPLEAVLTEPDEPSAAQHTGLSGNVGVAITGGSGTALNGGVKAGPSDLGGLSIKPTFALTMQSQLGLLFGADFLMQNGKYVDQSDFPSISVQQLMFNWTLDGGSLSSGALPTPNVALMGISVDIGSALTHLIAPILKPFYDATHGLVPLFDFLTSPMPIISQLLSIAGSTVPTSVIQGVLPSYQPGQTYDWLNFAVDMLADDGDISRGDAAVIAAIGNAAMKIIVEVDTAYSDIASLGNQDLGIPIGDFSFKGKNLALPQIDVTNASQFAAAGDQVAVIDDNIASAFASSGDDAFTNAIAGLSGAGPVGSALSTLSSAGGKLNQIAGDLDDALNQVTDSIDVAAGGASEPKINTTSLATVTFPFFSNPSSILGLIFGQNVQFINVDLGFAASVAATIPLFAVSFYGIVTASIDLNFKLDFDVGLQFGYDSQGFLDVAKDLSQGESAAAAAPDLLDGIYIAGDPLLKDTKYFPDVVKLDASIGASLNASLLLGLASVGLEGGIDVTANVYIADQKAANAVVHYEDFSQQTLFDVTKGFLGPLDVAASGNVFLALTYSSFWGLGPSGSITLATFNFFTWPNPPPNPQNIDPLGFYDPSSQTFDLYVGSTAKNREDPYGLPASPLYAQPTTPQEVLANDSSTYVINVNSDNTITVFWWNPVYDAWESQTPDGPVSEIIAHTGSGNNTILVNNLGPNSVKTDFTGSGGVQYNADQNSTTGGTYSGGAPVNPGSTGAIKSTTPTVGSIIGGDDVFEAAGGDATLTGGPSGNDVLVGSRNPAPGTTPDDLITAGYGNSTIVAGAGNDTIQTGAGNSLVYVGAGKEVIGNEKPPSGGSSNLQPGDVPPANSGGTGDSNPPGDDTLIAGGPVSFNVPFGPPGETLLGGHSVGETVNYGPPGQQQQSMIGSLAVNIAGDTTGDTTLITYDGAGPGNATFTMIDGLNTLSYAGLQSAVTLNLATGVATGPGIGTESIKGFSIVQGGPVASTLDGGTAAMGPETINGGSGGDNIIGGGGDDHIYGANGTGPYSGNTIYGGASANDTIYGGEGNNLISSGDGANIIHTGDGNDTVNVGNGANEVFGGVGVDRITAGNGNNLIDGGDGNDIILVGFGNNTINAALGNYSITAGNGDNTITGERGDDTMHVGSGRNSIFGGTGDDVIVAGTGANSINGGVGDDTMIVGIGGTGANTIQGSLGNDSIAVGDGANLVTGGTGDNVIMAGVGANILVGGQGREKIYAGVLWSQTAVGAAQALAAPLTLPVGGTGRNQINGGTGNDLIVVGDGANTITGGTGDDSLYAGVGANSILGGTGNDVIVAGVEWTKAAVVAGSAKSYGTISDPAIGGTGRNTIQGGVGDDLIIVGDGTNSVQGGTSVAQPYNNAIYAGVGANSITGGHGDDSIFAGVLWSQTGVAPTAVSKTHIGGIGANVILGGIGNDLIVAGDGTNSVTGGTGDDRIYVGVGTNTIVGGTGNEQIYAGVEWTQATVSTAAVTHVAIGGTGANTILGGVGDDLIEAGDGGNTIVGGTGNDTIYAGVGSNSIIGGVGNESIEAGVIWSIGPASVGGTGANTIYGGTGNDSIEAGNGANIIDGGIGDDIIISGFGNSTILGGTGNDRITVLGGDNVIKTGTGNSTVIGGAGSDLIESGDGATSVQGGAGTDTISLGDGNNTVRGGAGADIVTVGDGNNLIVGGTGADVITAGAGNNVIFGGASNNYIADGAGHATIEGGGGNDTIFGGALASTILGGQGDDVIVGGAGGNLIVGGQGENTIYGGAGGDTVYGGAQDNLLISEGGAAQIHGDHASLAFALSAVGVLTETAISPPAGATNNRATIYGGSGADSLYGGQGSDSIYGGPGTRLIVGGGQPTYIQGGAGTGVTIQGGAAGDVIIGSDGGHDSIVGGAGNNHIELRGGDDYASNGAGYGVIVGSLGNDILQGGSGGLNTLIGGSPTDQVIANSTEDTLDPDTGATSVYSTTGDALAAATVVPPPPTAPLPSDTVAQGWWSLVAGPAGMTLGGDTSNAASPAIVAAVNGPWVAWTQSFDGVQGLYVAQDVGGVWRAAGGSATGAGLALAGASASHPSIALIGGKPVVAFTSTTAAGRAIVVEAWNGSAWIGLGGSNAATGISGTGAFDNAEIVETANGPVVTWRNLAGAAPVLEALTFNGAAWVALGGAETVAGSSGVTSNYALATDGTHIAVAFSQATAYGAALTILQSSGGAFAALGSPIATPSVAGSNSFATAPTLAYAGGALFVAWVQEDPTTLYLPRLYTAQYAGGSWSAAGAGSDSGYGLAPQFTANDQPKLASNGTQLTLVWTATELTASGQTQNLMSLSWNGSAFAAVLPTDIAGTGIGALSTRANTTALALDPSGRPWLATDTTSGTGLQVYAGEAPSAYVVAGPQNTIAAILAKGVTPGELIIVAQSTGESVLTLTAADAGVAIVGLDGVSLGSVVINGAANVTLRNLIIPGGVSITNASGVTLAENTLGALTLSGATGLLARNNAIAGVSITAASGGAIRNNAIAGAAIGLDIAAPFAGLISNNAITGAKTAVAYAAAAALAGNRIYGAPVGVATAISDAATLFGAVAGSAPNIIEDNQVGVQLANAQVVNQTITRNNVGVSGSGLIGGAQIASYNVISFNQTGVGNFTGVVEYNRIEDNVVGVAATSELQIFSNQILANTQYGVLVSGVNNVQIAGNNIHSYLGDAIHLTASAYNIEIVSNILWADTGYDIYIDDNSQSGFWSDYNTLYATGAGRLVYWTMPFTDILDWQDDVALYDLHSVGVTIVNPAWAEPHFGVDAYGFEITRPLVGGQRASDPTQDGGDPAGSFIGFNGVANLLVNGNFENGLNGWTNTVGGAVVSNALTPFESTAEFSSGSAANPTLQQTVSLAAYSAEVDAGALQIAFGGMISLLSAASSAQISVQFYNAANVQIGDSVIVTAANVAQWTRAFQTAYAPVGARSVQFLFSVANVNQSAGALIDDAFLGVIAQGVGQDQGVRDAADAVPGDATAGRIQLTSPNLYQNWVASTPEFITWDSYGAAVGQAVDIFLMQETAHGLAMIANIATNAPNTGEFSWSPSQAGITPTVTGLRIEVRSAGAAVASGLSTETFSVPSVGSQFYVATPADGGSNRNTGVSAASPLPNPVNVFRQYAIGAGATINIAAGTYPLIVPLDLSGSTNLGLGLEQGFTIQGATTGPVVLTPANPDITPTALIELVGANHVTLNNLTLQGGVSALVVENGGDDFNASNLTALGDSGVAFNITTNSPNGVLTGLTAKGAGGAALQFAGTIKAIDDFTAIGDHDGIIASNSTTNSIGAITESTFDNNTGYGLDLYLTGAALIEGNTIEGDATGAYLSGSGIVFGDANVADGKGNIVSGNTQQAIEAVSGVEIAGNTISGNKGNNPVIQVYNGGQIVNNLIFGNSYGVDVYNGTGITISGNTIYNNGSYGVYLSASSATISGNTLTNNGVGLLTTGSNGLTITNNIFSGDAYAGVQLEYSTNALIQNNTFYELTAGSVADAYNTNYGVGALVIDNNSTGAQALNNILVVGAGAAIPIANSAQSGFVSNYNLFQIGAGARVGTWLGLSQTTLAQWNAATGQDASSQAGAADFVAPTATTPDFHLMSAYGSEHGGSLSVVLGAKGLPVAATATLTNDAATSPGVDGGNPASPLGAEPASAGDIIEIGAYGGTSQASNSAPAFLSVTSPLGGADLTQGASVAIDWNVFNVPGNVNILLSSDGGKTFSTVIAANVASSAVSGGNTGSYAWTIPNSLAGSNFVIEVVSVANAAVSGTTSAPFTIGPPVQIFYVNASSTAGQYSTAGGLDTNSGEAANAPVADLAALFGKGYTFSPGAIIYIDAGTYDLTQNIKLTAAYSGLTFQGATTGATIFDRQNASSSGFYDFEVTGATGVTFNNLTLTGAQIGLSLDNSSGSTGFTVNNSVFTGDGDDVYVGTDDNGVSIVHSTLGSPARSYGVDINTASGAYVSDDVFTLNAASGGFAYGVELNSATGAVVSNNTLTGSGAYDPTLISASSSTNVIIDNNKLSGSDSQGIYAYLTGGVIAGNNVNATGGSFGIEGSGTSTKSLLIENNGVYGEIAANSTGGAINLGNYARAVGNTVDDSYIGFYIDGGVAQGNLIYGDTYGAELESGGALEGNRVYENTAVGVIVDTAGAIVENNTIYDNPIGIQVGNYSGSSGHTIDNNTIVQTSGEALYLATSRSDDTIFFDNIVSLKNAVGIVAPTLDQTGFVSDYNLYDLQSGAAVATWSGQTIATLDAFKAEVGSDLNSFEADPDFNNAGADDYTLSSASPALNRGDPALPYLSEPVSATTGNGDRIDIGAQGGTASANASPAQLIQLLGQTGGQRYQVGQSATIDFRSAGLTSLDPVVFINAGGAAVQGSQFWNVWQGNEYDASGGAQYPTTTPVAANGLNVPQAVLQSTLYFNSRAPLDTFAVPLADGNYQVTLTFVDTFSSDAVGTNVFNIIANGVTEVAKYDVVKAAGGDFKATQVTFAVAATGGQGLNLGLQATAGSPLISGIQISRVNPAPSTWTASVQVSYAGGAAGSWTTIASGLPLDTFGAGSFSFTPTQASTNGLLRIVATNGTQSLVDQSLGSFTSVPATTEFYIATPANGGSDANNGTSASTPMADLATLLNVYTLQPGDTVHIGPGTYTLPTSINLGALASGSAGDPVIITGAGASTIFQGVTTGNGTLPPIFQFNGGHDITLENMTLQGGGAAVNVVANSGAVDLTLKNLNITGFTQYGVNVGQGATNFAFVGGQISAPASTNSYGVSINYAQGATITGSSFSGVSYGVDFEYVTSINVSGNNFSGDYIGVNANYTPVATTKVTVDDNLVSGASNSGISLSLPYVGANVTYVERNTVTATKGTGIFMFGPGLVENNIVSGAVIGIEGENAALITHNTVSNSSDDGIEIAYGGGTASYDTLIGNATGLYTNVGGVFVNDLIYASTAYGAYVLAASTLDNDTFVQTQGVAAQIATSSAVNVENDIFDLSGGVVYGVPVADQGGLYANYNLYDLQGAAVMANWAGASATAQGLTVASFDDWMFGTGQDRNSEAGAPVFAYAADKTPVWDDFVLQPGSLGIAQGDPASRYDQEPLANGGRISMGLEGDTPYATASAAATVVVTSPAPLTKLQDGITTTITFATSGISGLQAIARVNVGGSAIAGATASTNWVAGPSPSGATSTTSAINVAGALAGAPAQVYQSAVVGAYGIGSTLNQAVAVADGTYRVTLNFASYGDYVTTNRIFNIVINGVTVATNFNIFAAAGNQNNVAVDRQFTVTASGGAGIVVQLVSQSASYGAMISGIEIDRPTASVAGATALVEVSPDGGLNWTTVAAAAPLDAWGNGAVAWTPNFITNGNTARVRVSVNGLSAQSQPFLVANAGNDYYINGATTTNAQYATARGNDLNSGKTPNAPMANLAALLRAYTLAPGDVVFIDAGSYTMLTDALVGSADSGAANAPLTFQGPTNGAVATLNRANALYGNVIQIAGASYVDIDNLTLTGGNIGIDVPDNVVSRGISADDVVITNENTYGVYFGSGDTGLTLTGSQIYGNNNGSRNTGIYAQGSSGVVTITGDKIFGQYTGIYLSSEIGLVSDDSLYQNAAYGLQYQGSSTTVNPLVVSNNKVFNNGDSSTGNYGLWIQGNVVVTGNTIYGQTASGDVGILVFYGAVATGNTIYNNYIGLTVNDASVTVTGDRIFDNSYAGVTFSYSGGSLLDDQIYSNGVGVLEAQNYYGSVLLENDLIYQNASNGVQLTGGASQIINDTIWQSTGTAITLTNQTTSVLANDIVWTDAGTLLNISASSVAGFQALYNFYYEGAATTPATLVNYGGTVYANLAAWRAGVGSATVTSVNGVLAQNAGSIEGNPQFVDPAGADGVLGGLDTPLGGGKDDNFTPSKTSPAIDAGDGYLAPGADMLGQPRSDDLSVANSGTGAPAYDVSTLTAVTPPAGTTATLISGSTTTAGRYATYTLPFNFTFYGISYSKVYVGPNGAIYFNVTAAQNAAFASAPSASALATTPMIAPFWSGAISTQYYYSNNGVFATTSASNGVNYVTFSYAASPLAGPSNAPLITFAVTLGSDGSIQFDYGANLNGLAAVIGVSGGKPGLTTLAATSGQTNLSGAPAILFTPDAAKGQTYTDIGAVEFEGQSNANALPTVVSTTNLPASSPSTTAVFTSITLQFSAALNPVSAVSAANYLLVDLSNGNASIALTPIYSAATDSVTLALAGGPLADGRYQLTVSGDNALIDASGNPLNGANDTTNTPSAFIRTFTIDRSAIQPPTTTTINATTPSNQTLAVTLQASDPQSLAITYAITQAPQHGAVENFSAATGAFTYVPDVGYVGADTILYSATDSELASAAGAVDINVTAYRTAPIAYAASASAISTRPTTITLQGYDANTAVGNLTLSIVTAPAHGALTVTGQNTVSYTGNAGYAGSDSFAYEWLDATASPTLASAPATVSLLVTSVNEAPTTSATTIPALENAPYTFKLSDFPYADPNNAPATPLQSVLIATLPGSGTLSDNHVALIAGALVSAADIAAGKLVYTPAANVYGAGVASFSFAVVNSGGTANGGQNTSGPATATINVSQVNLAPSTSAAMAQAYEKQPLALTSALFSFSDPNTPAEALAGIVLTSLPGAGALTLLGAGGTATAPLNQLITKAQLDAGDLVFTPAANAFGPAYAAFGFEVVDAGSTANGGKTTSTAATFTINVAAVNQAPTTASAAVTAYMNVPYTFALASFPYSDAANTPATALKSVVVVSLPKTGALTDAGGAVTAGQAISAADIANGLLVYKPAGNAVGAGAASFTFEVRNSGGTANGGVDTSAAATLTFNIQQKQPGANGTYAITYLGPPGAAYATQTITYSALGRELSVAYSTGETAVYSYTTSGALLSIAYSGVKGEPYTSYTVTYGAGGRIANISYSNGQSATYAYNANGTLHDILYAGIKGQAYTAYDVVYGANGKIAAINYLNGATPLYAAAYTYAANGTYQIATTGVSGVIDGQTFVAYTTFYSAAGVRQETIYYGAGGVAVVTVTYTNGADPVTTLGAYDGAAPPETDAVVLVAEGADAPTATTPSAQPDGRRYDDWLLFGAPAPQSAESAAFAPAPSREALAQALLLTGIALPLAARGAVKPKRKPTLSVFDPATDSFERIDPSEDAWELPFAAPAETGDGECDFL